VVEKDHAIEGDQWMMQTELDDPGTESDPVGPLRRGRYHYLWCGDVLPSGAVVLTDPGFGVAKSVQQRDQVEITLQRLGRVFGWVVKGL